MLVAGDARHKRQYPQGPRREMTAAWKALVIDAMKRQGVDRTTLARMVGAHKTALTKMFKAQQSSALVDKICDVLNIPPPTVSPKEFDDLDKEISALDREERERALVLIRAAFPPTRR